MSLPPAFGDSTFASAETVERHAAHLAWRSRLTHGWDNLSIYLPVLIMGLLALGSYWILHTTPMPSAAAPDRPATHDPDYFMRDFSVRSYYPDGALKSEVYGTEGRHYPDTDTLEMDQARIRSFNEDGRLTTSVAQRILTNGDQNDYLLSGQVRVVRDAAETADGKALPQLTFEGEELRVLTDDKKLMSNQPVTMTRGQDRVKADRLDYDDNTRVAVLQGRVRAVFMPR